VSTLTGSGSWTARRLGRLYITLAALAWSSAGLLQRELSLDPVTQVAGRAAFALLALLTFTGVVERGDPWQAFRTMGSAGLAFAASVAIGSAAFITALNHTTVANVLVMQAASPIVAALLAWLLLGETVTSRTWTAMGIAFTGVALMAGGPGGRSLGIAIGFVLMLGFAAAIVIARYRSDVSMAPGACLAQLLLVVVLAPLSHFDAIGGRDIGLLAALGIGQIGLGLAFLTLGAQLIPAAEVGLISLLEVVLGPLWVWIARSEQPAAVTIAGGAAVIAAVVYQTLGEQ
jgi:drug/metabolite transporter (DMT)-like permease